MHNASSHAMNDSILQWTFILLWSEILWWFLANWSDNWIHPIQSSSLQYHATLWGLCLNVPLTFEESFTFENVFHFLKFKCNILTFVFIINFQEFSKDRFYLVIGNYEQIQRRHIKEIEMHPDYTKGSLFSNIALVKLDDPFDRVKPLYLPCGRQER